MIRQEFHVKHYWKVIVFYDVNYNLFNIPKEELIKIGFSNKILNTLRNEIKAQRIKAVTCSNLEKHVSILLILPHPSNSDYLNSIVHEAEHVKQAMLDAYKVEDQGEPPAYTIGYIVGQMWRVVRNTLCKC